MNNIYEYTVPIFIKTLGGVRHVLEKAAASGLDEQTLLNDRLAPDMFPLVKQVQMATDNAKGATARLAGIEVPVFPDMETTIAELQARIDSVLAFITSVPRESFADAGDRKVTLGYYPGKYMLGYDYAREYALPNFFFHAAMTYALVRKNGVAIGKADYINGMPLKDA
jgi:hypothetical protein